MKIGMFSDSFFPIVGGRENVIDNSVRALSKNNQIFVCAPKMKGEIPGKTDAELPYKIYRCKSLRIAKSEYLATPNKKFKKLVEAERPDIIHCQTKYGLLHYAFKLRKKFNIPVVTTIHTNYKCVYEETLPKLIGKFALKRVIRQLNKCDKIFAVSNYMKNQVESLGVKKPIVVLKNGTNPYAPKLSKQEQFDLVNKQFEIDKDAFMFLFVGRLYEVKNIKFQLETIKNLAKTTDKKFLFLLVGSGPDEENYKKICKETEIENYVKFAGQITDNELLSAIYSRADVFYFASIRDNDPLTIVEAAYNGTPSLVVENTGGAERITHNYNGFISKDNLDDMQNAMLDLLNGKYDLETISKNAKNEIPRTWDEIAKDFEKEYQNVIENYQKSNKK